MPDEPITAQEHWRMRIYEDGSATCRNYSTLTMHVRTLAALVLAGGSGALVLTARELNADAARLIIFIGALLVTLTVTLVLTNWHYQSAFEVIRDKLAAMEAKELGQPGPWCAHKGMRDAQNDLISSYGPFVVMAFAGTIAVAVGVYHLTHTTGLAINWGGCIAIGFFVLGKWIHRNEARAKAAVRAAEMKAKAEQTA